MIRTNRVPAFRTHSWFKLSDFIKDDIAVKTAGFNGGLWLG